MRGVPLAPIAVPVLGPHMDFVGQVSPGPFEEDVPQPHGSKDCYGARSLCSMYRDYPGGQECGGSLH